MVTSKKLHDACGGIACLDFVNTLDRVSDRAPEEWPDALSSYADLLTWSTQAGTLASRRARDLARTAADSPKRAAKVFRRGLALREAIYSTYIAIAHERAPKRADIEAINAELALALAHARVEPQAGSFVWAWTDEPGTLDAPLWPIAGSAAELLVSDERELVRECAGNTCLWLFLDRTKNHRRRWCEMKTCGNRAKVREHRRRRAKGMTGA